MLYACAASFNVTENLKNFESFLETKQGRATQNMKETVLHLFFGCHSVGLLACGWSHLDRASTFSHHD